MRDACAEQLNFLPRLRNLWVVLGERLQETILLLLLLLGALQLVIQNAYRAL